MVGYMSRVTLNFDLSKILLFISSQGQDLCSTKNWTCTFTGSHLRAVTDADDDNAGHHRTTTRVTYRQ